MSSHSQCAVSRQAGWPVADERHQKRPKNVRAHKMAESMPFLSHPAFTRMPSRRGFSIRPRRRLQDHAAPVRLSLVSRALCVHAHRKCRGLLPPAAMPRHLIRCVPLPPGPYEHVSVPRREWCFDVTRRQEDGCTTVQAAARTPNAEAPQTVGRVALPPGKRPYLHAAQRTWQENAGEGGRRTRAKGDLRDHRTENQQSRSPPPKPAIKCRPRPKTCSTLQAGHAAAIWRF